VAKYIAVFAFLIVITGGYFLISKKDTVRPTTNAISTTTPFVVSKEADFKANFEIYTNGTKRIFTDSKYHNQSGDVFIEADSPNTVRVKKEGITWSNFFETLPMSLKKDCLITGTNQTFCTGSGGTLRFYINGTENGDALDRRVKEGDTLLVEYGSNT
jgi:hypothetical protein